MVDNCTIPLTTHSPSKIFYPYNINNVELKRVSNKKDLGVIMDDKLSFNEQMDYITTNSQV